jgi:hypothetical protein
MLSEKMNLDGIAVDWAEEFEGAITVCDKDGIIEISFQLVPGMPNFIRG